MTFLLSNMNNAKQEDEVFKKLLQKIVDPCLGQYIYVYDLPARFNEDLLKGCHSLQKWENMCVFLSNLGVGPKIIEKSKKEVLSKKNWYATNQYSLEVIFHNIMKHYKCLTNDSSLASAIYVPFYAGLDAGQYLWEFNISIRDKSPNEFVKWLGQQSQWKRLHGKDHFMVGGRIGCDFRREGDSDHNWGTKLMFLPEVSNMSFLLIESCKGLYDNEFPIPYPTYFHPTNDDEIFKWQRKMRNKKRDYLFTFVGAPRPDSPSSVRNQLIKHCESSKSCKRVGCYHGSSKKISCRDPVQVMDNFQNSGKVMINETLFNVSKSEVLAMREEVIRLIPRIVYRYPGSRLETIEDAFDIAVKGVLGRIEAMRRQITNVNDSYHAKVVALNNLHFLLCRGKCLFIQGVQWLPKNKIKL
ncbi:putative exostosin [Medicago truncatula]|uniref:Putative exostosin n=1 Tax=Medicago truncatula TaxID=3880 RepID=A0A396HZV4_MEDTR|nr:putative exostosin [Medicago truncatula]